ncbi:MAG: hypothetical protein HY054_08430 [Proteobacteria bacterium]|nr:hypothetical protein [Pseudomonadota bacterium]
MRSITVWPAWTVLLLIATTIAQYAFCAFVTPDAEKGEDIDLVAFHAQQRRRYLSVIIVFSALALVFNFAFGGADYYTQWLRDSICRWSGWPWSSSPSSSAHAGRKR